MLLIILSDLLMYHVNIIIRYFVAGNVGYAIWLLTGYAHFPYEWFVRDDKSQLGPGFT